MIPDTVPPLVRRLRPPDAPAYRALMLKGYAAHPDAFTATVPERAQLPLSWWAGRLHEAYNPSDLVFGAFFGPQLIGVIGLQFNSRPKTCHKAGVFGLYVDAECTGKGAGRALVDAALAGAAARSGVVLVQLTVTEGNDRARVLYQLAGFQPFGVEPYAVLDESGYKGKIHMWRLLTPIAGRLDPASP